MSTRFNLGYPANEYKTDRAGFRGTSLQSFFGYFPDEETCLAHVFRTRFGHNPHCCECNKPGIWYRISGTRRFQHPCGKSISPLAGTFAHKSHLSLQLSFYAMLLYANSPEGIPSSFLVRQLGVSHKAAFRLGARIRGHLAALDKFKRVGRPGEAVEVRIDYLDGVRSRVFPTRGVPRVVLVGDIDHVQATVVSRPRLSTVRAIIYDKCASGTRYVTTCEHTYNLLADYGRRKPVVELVKDFDAEKGRNTNPLNSYLAYVRRPMRNTYRRVDYGNLWIYLKELEFRFNRRSCSQTVFPDMIAKFPMLTSMELKKLKQWSHRVAGGDVASP